MWIASCVVMVAISLYLKKEMSAILVNQNIPKRIEISCHVDILCCFVKSLWLLVAWVKTINNGIFYRPLSDTR